MRWRAEGAREALTGVSAAHRASVGETGALDLTCLAVWPSHGQLRVLGCLITLSGVEPVLAVCGAKIAGIDASILTYRYLLRALGAAAALVKGNDASFAEKTFKEILAHFHKMPTEWARRGCCRAQRTARPGTNMRF